MRSLSCIYFVVILFENVRVREECTKKSKIGLENHMEEVVLRARRRKVRGEKKPTKIIHTVWNLISLNYHLLQTSSCDILECQECRKLILPSL